MSRNMKRILIIEDNRDFHEFYRFTLDEEVFDLNFQSSAIDGFEEVRRNQYDLILLDILMEGPGFNGMGFMWRLRKQLNSPTPVIITTVLDKDVCKGIKHLGHFVFLHKPFTEEKLLRAIRRYLHT